MRNAFFITNVLISILFMAVCASAMSSMESVFAFLAGIVLLPLAAAFAVAEWIARFRQKHGVEKGLAVACLILAAFAAYMVVLTVIELSQRVWTTEDRWFVFAGSAISVYFVVCGVWRIRASKHLASRCSAQPPAQSAQ